MWGARAPGLPAGVYFHRERLPHGAVPCPRRHEPAPTWPLSAERRPQGWDRVLKPQTKRPALGQTCQRELISCPAGCFVCGQVRAECGRDPGSGSSPMKRPRSRGLGACGKQAQSTPPRSR